MIRETRPCSQTSRVQHFLKWQFWYKHWVCTVSTTRPFLESTCKTPTVKILFGCIFFQVIVTSRACSGLSQCVMMVKVTCARKWRGNSVLQDLCWLWWIWNKNKATSSGTHMDSSRFLLDADANLVPFFFLQEALRLISVRRKLFASGRNAVCVALPEILTNSS